MPQVDARPAALDTLARPGNTITYTLTFPAGYLTGKTWAASIGGTALVPSIAGAVMTIPVSGAVTTALGSGRHRLLFTDTTGDDQVRISGRVLLTESATSSPDQTVTVTIADVIPVTVEVASGEPGVPSGGDTGQALVKASDDDFDTEWADVAGGGGAPSGPAGGDLAGTYPNPTLVAASVLAKLLTVDGSGSGLDADLVDGQSGAYYLARANHSGTQLASTISDLAEATDDRVATLLVAGTNITLTYDDVLGTLTIDAAAGGGGGLTQEQAEDIVAALIDDNSDLDWTYDDATASLVAVIKAGSVTNAMLAGSIDLAKLATDPLARANHTGEQAVATVTGLQAALDAKIPTTEKATANGVATLDAGGLIPSAQLPPIAISNVYPVASQAAMLALTAERGDVALRTDLDPDGWFILTTDSPGTLADWTQITAVGAVSSVDGRTGTVSLTDLYDAAGSAAAAQAAAVQRANHTGSQSADTLTDGTTNKAFLATERTKLAGIETAATADQTAAEILAALLTVDGAGSGLDADTLDGTSSAGFETPAGAQAKADAKVADAINDGTTGVAPSQNAVFDALALKAPTANPTFTGTVTIPDGALAIADTSGLQTALDAKLALAGGTLTGKLIESVVALTDGANIALDAALGNVFTVTLGGNRTLDNPTNPVNGQKIVVRVRQDATGSRTLAYGSAYRFGVDVASPTLTTTAAKTDYLGFIYNGTDSKWDCVAVSKGY